MARVVHLWAKRGTKLEVNGTTDGGVGNTIDFYYIPGDSLDCGPHEPTMPSFGATKVLPGNLFYMAFPTTASAIPGVGRVMRAVLDGNVACARVEKPKKKK